jgi:hypothetical protein
LQVLVVVWLQLLVACSDGDARGERSRSCDPGRGLLLARQVLEDENDPCRPWLEGLYGRAVRIPGEGSGSIWSRRTRYGTGLLVTAAHVLTPCARDADCLERLQDPKQVTGRFGIRLTDASAVFASQWSAAFALYNPFTPLAQVGSAQIAPRSDVSVYAVDRQLAEAWGWGRAIAPGPIVDAPLPLYDPHALSKATPTWTAARPGTRLLVLGYPFQDGIQKELSMIIGRVLDDVEAEQGIRELKAAGDEEGNFPYEPHVELILKGDVFEGRSLSGISGGGVYDENGLQVALVVRGSFADLGVQYMRAVRMSYITQRIETSLMALPVDDQTAIAPYLESP